jgi:hypothetical protein
MSDRFHYCRSLNALFPTFEWWIGCVMDSGVCSYNRTVTFLLSRSLLWNNELEYRLFSESATPLSSGLAFRIRPRPTSTSIHGVWLCHPTRALGRQVTASLPLNMRRPGRHVLVSTSHDVSPRSPPARTTMRQGCP